MSFFDQFVDQNFELLTTVIPTLVIGIGFFLAIRGLLDLRNPKLRDRRNNVVGFQQPVKKRKWAGPYGMADPLRQMRAISMVEFERTRVWNASEYRVYCALETIIAELDGGHRVMAQTSLGELIRPKQRNPSWKLKKDAFASINSKRLDFAVIDKNGFLAAAIEYQGAGHHQKDAFMRDAVKREALRRAGVPFVEVEQGTTPTELKDRVVKALG